MLNVRDFGAVGDGIADDAAAIQRALDQLNRTTDAAGNDKGGGANGIVFFPPGTYRLTSTLVYRGNYSLSAYFIGEFVDGGNSHSSTRLVWDGPDNQTLFEWKGASHCVMRHLSLDGGQGARSLLRTHAWLNHAGQLQTGGTSNKIEYCKFAGTRADVECISIGNENVVGATYQCDQLEINFCYFGGNAAGLAPRSTTCGTAIRTHMGGNTKNFRVRGGVAAHLSYFFDWLYASGALWCEGVMLADISAACFVVGGGGIANIHSISVEAGPYDAYFLKGTGGTNKGTCTIQGCSAMMEKTCPADDAIIDWYGNLTLIGNQLHNTRPGARPKINIMATSLNGGLVSIGNFYQGCEDGEFLPVEDGGGNNLTGIDPVNSYAQVINPTVVSINDIGGDFGGQVGRLRPMFGRILSFNRLQPITPDAAMAVIDAGEVRRSHSRIRVPHTAWTSFTAQTQTLILTKLHAKTRVVGVVVETMALHQGPPGSITAKVGYTTGGEEYILEHDVKTGPLPLAKGLIDSELGPSLQRTNAVQGGHVPSWAGQSEITLTLTTNAGNLSALTAGTIDVYLTLDVMS